MRLDRIQIRLDRHAPALVVGLVVVALMVVWAIHDGGYDEDTWYWGALILLCVAGAVMLAGAPRMRVTRAASVALIGFGAYVAWSYLSIAWAQSPGDALQGSNRALLYLLVFALMVALPWTPEAALIAVLIFVVGVGVIAVVLLVRLASADHVQGLVIGGRLAAPTGYINSTAALFTVGSLTATALAARRELPALLRGLLIAFACAGLQLALIVQSRGWLFTLPLVALVAIILVPDRLRVFAFSLLPAAGVLAPVRRLLRVYQSSPGPALNHAAAQAGKAALVICAAILIAGVLIAWGESLLSPREFGRASRRALGTALASLVVAAVCAGGVAATHGHPFRFIARQWNGFSHESTANTGSHFTDVGSGRYDFWRVSLDAFLAHPVDGLGQDNFADYYIKHRHTSEEPQWPHSLELRLLAMTGIVGFALFAAFLLAAIAAALGNRRRGSPFARGVTAAALLPLVVWLIHGSIDWFWEMPALSAPALGFLGVAAALGSPPRSPRARTPELPVRSRLPRMGVSLVAGLAFIAAFIALGFPYLSVRESSVASNVAAHDPSAALRDLSRAADLNPFSADPGVLGGAIALRTGQFAQAKARFAQAISRDPGDWFSWLGAGLAASSLGDRASARHDFAVAASINSRQPVIAKALGRVSTAHPLTARQALQMVVLAP